MQPEPEGAPDGDDDGTWKGDDGTWQAPTRGPAPEGDTNRDDPISHDHTPDSPTTDPTLRRGETPPIGDSAESTPRADSESGDEWDALPPPRIAEDQEVFDKKYRLVKKIGEGGMGEVWQVENLNLDRISALKLIKPEVAKKEKVWQRFRREAHLMAKLQHPNAVAIYDYRRSHSMAYIEMEFVRGQSLDRYLKDRRGETIPLGWIADLLDQLCSVLQEAHGYVDERTGKPRPIIHRDLKPSNLMLVDRKPPGQNLKVLDFGIAKMLESEGSHEATLTGIGDLMGTPAYMSPEQIRGGWGKEDQREVDGRSDLYAVGVILYQLITGEVPFRRGDYAALLAAQLTQQPRSFKAVNPGVDVPPAVERLVMQCLEKEPDRRPQNAQELMRMFRAAAGLSVQPQPQPLGGGIRLVLPAIAAACVALVGLGALAAYRFPSSTETNKGEVGVGPIIGPETKGDPKSTPKAYVPAGYKAVDELAEGSDEPLRIQRTDGPSTAIFDRYGPGIYLPAGYEAADPSDTVGAWPRVIQRKTPDAARFIFLKGGPYRRGDPGSNAQLDFRRNPIVPHWVHVADFYIQETEVTNGEVEDYLRSQPEDIERLAAWRTVYDKQKAKTIPETEARFLPASYVSHDWARKYALENGGRLPTEAQWEYAARSAGREDWIFPWGKEPPSVKGRPLIANLHNAFASGGGQGEGEFQPLAKVTVFNLDQTDQHVYDMAGNVSELCRDVYEPYSRLKPAETSKASPLPDPGASEPRANNGDKPTFVVRGGSVNTTNPVKAHTYYRDGVGADDLRYYIGFRLVIECPPEREQP